MDGSVRLMLVFWLAVFVSAAGLAQAAGPLRLLGTGDSVIRSGAQGATLAGRDSLTLIGPWGSGALFNGQFEDQWGIPAWNGWTHQDMTIPPSIRWSISDYHAENLGGHGAGNLAAWCGEDIFPACTPWDEAGGYGNNYHELIGWTGTVANAAEPCTVTVEARLNLQMEPGYDFLALIHLVSGNNPLAVWEEDGSLTDLAFSETFVVQPEDYVGTSGVPDQVVLRFRVTSDGAFSDADCFFPTSGACQIDDITVSLSNGGFTTFTDFESGDWTDWQPLAPQGVGDFAQILWSLEDLDPCVSNWSPQAVFIDDGYVIPETGGQFCLNWCYGPGGYIVNTQGGLAGSDSHLANRILSPAVPWPANDAEGALFSFGVYEHEDLGADAPGMFYLWDVRSTSSLDPSGLEGAPWKSRNYVYYGGPGYIRRDEDISSLLVPGATYVQISLSVQELGYFWNWNGDDGYPAPYFDNVRLVAYPQAGPQISVRHIDLAQDGFPAQGFLDLVDEASNSVRFDMAQNIALPAQWWLDPGDSIVADVTPLRNGADLVGQPTLHYRLEANPAFAAYRTSGLPNEGFVEGTQVIDGIQILPNRFAFDLPDTGFFYPGDVIHYYLEATSSLDGAELTTIVPADTAGFGDFLSPLAYDPVFTVRALPSVSRNGYTDLLSNTPRILFWDDGKDLENWVMILEAMGQSLFEGYDVFSTRSPSSGAGNGLGSRATPELLDHYRTLLYSSGDLGIYTLCNGDLSHDGSGDLALLDAWMQLGDKSMLLMGDQLVGDLGQSGLDGQQFRDTWLKVDHQSWDLRPLIGGQSAPQVVSTAPEIFAGLQSWIAYGGCPGINTFDAMAPQDPAVRIAEFSDPNGQTGAYPYAAAVLHDLPEDKTVIPSHNSAVITFPYDLQFIYTDPASPPFDPPASARQAVLFDVLSFFGEIIIWGDAPLPDARVLSASNHPNPFNPVTRIEYHLPRAGKLAVKVYDTRGHLVRTLVNEARPAGPGFVVWNGHDDNDRSLASGLYFYQVEAGDQTVVNKMMLLK